ncbi:hypothetical protein [Fimbriimonas ginsengisoli]|uniref:Lipoprotein n=1 Tax=Fimbriimonas ginsengisoli Gsoil 348 TaxID=661478 RepID=A0A068NMM8_FIMGI|nr:hypothetical protein [Fimbriimonas ginsengisoli]AIE84823.1 hypothetical protein OP10G_1455 [Fimbriimonas ginsengisoli Gsoil 348]
MTKRFQLGLLIAIASGLSAGCNSSDSGTVPPPTAPLTQDQLDKMPPEARAAAQNASKAGDAQSQRMKEMADAQKKAEGGK